MDYTFLAIGILFGISTAGIPVYAFITKHHFMRQKNYFFVQGLFWIAIAGLSIYNLFTNINTFAMIINAILGIVGLVFGFYALSAMRKDKGAYVLPYAKNGNKAAFEEYVSNLDVNKIEIKMTTAGRYDVVLFTTCTPEQKAAIIDEVSTNESLTLQWRCWDAWKRLIASFTFGLFIIAIALLL